MLSYLAAVRQPACCCFYVDFFLAGVLDFPPRFRMGLWRPYLLRDTPDFSEIFFVHVFSAYMPD